MSRNNASMPNVRASSGMIGTTCRPISLWRNNRLSSRTNCIVVDCSSVVPLSISPTSSRPVMFNAGARFVRAGNEPPSACRRACKYFISGLSAGGR